MIYRMGAAMMSLLGLFVSAYLYLYKIGRIGTLACGSGSCETVQLSPWSRVAGVEVRMRRARQLPTWAESEARFVRAVRSALSSR